MPFEILGQHVIEQRPSSPVLVIVGNRGSRQNAVNQIPYVSSVVSSAP
jgi:hypothetical protein